MPAARRRLDADGRRDQDGPDGVCSGGYFFEDDWLFCSPPAAERLLLAGPDGVAFLDFGAADFDPEPATVFFSITTPDDRQ